MAAKKAIKGVKRLKIQFIVPPTKEEKIPDRVFGCNYAFFFQHNIFALYPATLLQKKGYDVSFDDCVVEKKSLEEAIDKATSIFVFYSVFLSRKEDLKAAKKILKLVPNAKIVFMGSDPTYKPENYVKSKSNFVVRGEPEYTLLDFVNYLQKNADVKDFSKIKGLSWLKGKKVSHNEFRPLIENLDKLPFPDRSLMKVPKKYYNAKFKKMPTTTMLTSRNCPFRCYYCVPNSLSFARELEYKRWFRKKPPVSRRSPKNIIAEFKEVAKQGYKSVFVLDDQFIWGVERTINILDWIKKLNLEISILARCDMLQDKRLAKKLKEAGVSHVDLGVESYDPKILKYIRKDLDVVTMDKCVRLLKKEGIEPEINIMIGSCPLETKETIRKTFDKVENLDVEIVHAKICSPFPGTDFHDIAKKKGWMTTKEYVPIDTASESLISYPNLSDKAMVKEIKKFYRRHYFNPKYIVGHLFTIKSPRELWYKAKTALRMWKNILKG